MTEARIVEIVRGLMPHCFQCSIMDDSDGVSVELCPEALLLVARAIEAEVKGETP